MSEKITLKETIKKKINSNTIWLTGPARSGTSIIGKIIASFKSTEYFYESDLFVSLFALKKLKIVIGKFYLKHTFILN